jgi:hypothetical protein
MSNNPAEPVVLELAPLPREQVGPFVLLGVEKTADHADVDRSWAERIKLARRQQITVPLEDINWAREILSDHDRRIRADAASLNLDSADGVLRELSERYGADMPAELRCKPLDVEKDLANYSPPIEMPDMQTVKASIVVPDIPEEVPAARSFLEKFLREPLDPWSLPIRW